MHTHTVCVFFSIYPWPDNVPIQSSDVNSEPSLSYNNIVVSSVKSVSLISIFLIFNTFCFLFKWRRIWHKRISKYEDIVSHCLHPCKILISAYSTPHCWVRPITTMFEYYSCKGLSKIYTLPKGQIWGASSSAIFFAYLRLE